MIGSRIDEGCSGEIGSEIFSQRGISMKKIVRLMVFIAAGYFCIGQGTAIAGFFSFGEKKDAKPRTGQEAPAANSQQTGPRVQEDQRGRSTAKDDTGAVTDSFADDNSALAQLPTANLPSLNPAANLPKVPSVPRAISTTKANLTTPVRPPALVRPMVPTLPIPPALSSTNRGGDAAREAQKNLNAIKNRRQETIKVPKA
jgi:hypothetical protein